MHSRRRGQSLTEVAIVLALIAIAAIFIVTVNNLGTFAKQENPECTSGVCTF